MSDLKYLSSNLTYVQKQFAYYLYNHAVRKTTHKISNKIKKGFSIVTINCYFGCISKYNKNWYINCVPMSLPEKDAKSCNRDRSSVSHWNDFLEIRHVEKLNNNKIEEIQEKLLEKYRKKQNKKSKNKKSKNKKSKNKKIKNKQEDVTSTSLINKSNELVKKQKEFIKKQKEMIKKQMNEIELGVINLDFDYLLLIENNKITYFMNKNDIKLNQIKSKYPKNKIYNNINEKYTNIIKNQKNNFLEKLENNDKELLRLLLQMKSL